MSDGKSRFRTSPLILAMTLIVLLVSAVPSALAYSPSWDTMTPSIDVQTQAVVIAWNDENTIYVIGGAIGVNGGTYDRQVDNVTGYSVVTGESWHAEPMPVGVMGACGALGDDKRIYVFSGQNDSFGNVKDTQIYSIADDSWTSGTDMPDAAWHGQCVVVWPNFYVIGGYNSSSTTTNKTWIYNALTDSWSAGKPLPARRMAGAAAYSEKENSIFYMGGADESSITQKNVYRLNLESNSWSKMGDMPSLLAAFGATVGVDGLIYIAGGSDNYLNIIATFDNSAHYYYPNNDTWASAPDLTHGRKYLGLASMQDGHLYAIGGNDNAHTFSYVESLQIVKVGISLSSSTVGQGNAIVLGVQPEAAFAEQTRTLVSFYLKSAGGTTYPMRSDLFSAPGNTSSIIEIPQVQPAGSYQLVIVSTIYFETGEYTTDVQKLSLTITATIPLQQQINDLNGYVSKLNSSLNSALNQISDLKHLNDEQQNDIDDLLAQLNQTNSDLNDAMNQLNEKAGNAQNSADSAGTYAMIALALGVILTIVLIINMMMARKR